MSWLLETFSQLGLGLTLLLKGELVLLLVLCLSYAFVCYAAARRGMTSGVQVLMLVGVMVLMLAVLLFLALGDF